MMLKLYDGYFFTSHFLSCFILIILPSIFHWDPMIAAMNMKKLPIYNALTSNDFRTSLYASLAVSAPMVLQLIFRIFVDPSILFSFYKGLSNIILVIWIIATDALILSIVIPNQDLMTYTLISHLRVILLIWSVGIYLYCYSENKIWHSKLTVGLFVCINSTRVIHYYDIFFKTPLILQQANSAFLGVCYILILIQCARWFYSTHKKYKSKRIPSKETFCGVYVFASTGISIGAFYIFCYYRNTLWYEADSSNLCAQTMAYTFFYLIYAVFQGNAFEREAQSSKLALEIKQLFIRYMSHEMRSPLNAVMMGLEHLKEELNKSGSGDMSDKIVVIEEIKESCGVAIQTLNDMLLHDQIETGSLKVEPENVKIIPLVQNVVRQFQFQANQLGIELTIAFSDNRDCSNDTTSADWNNLMISADPKKIAHVFRNIISNALKFTPRTGAVVVRISKATDKIFSLGSIKIDVIDTGVGISSADQSKLFHGAIQFLPGKLQEGEGSGLGLYISKGIVDGHRGILTVTSEGEGRGSTFTVLLPLLSPVASATDAIVQYMSTRNPAVGVAVHPDAAAMTVEQSSLMNVIDVRRENSFPEESMFAPALSVRYSPPPLSNVTSKNSSKRYADKKSDSEAEEKLTNVVVVLDDIISLEERRTEKQPVVLVVDDMASNRKMLRRLLVDRCEYALEAVDGQEAVDIVREALSKGGEEGRVDVITMDYQMPVMDGPTATKAIRDLGYKGIIVGVTGNVLSKDIRTFIAAGADTVLTKPLNIKTFDSTILELSMKNNSIARNRQANNLEL